MCVCLPADCQCLGSAVGEVYPVLAVVSQRAVRVSSYHQSPVVLHVEPLCIRGVLGSLYCGDVAVCLVAYDKVITHLILAVATSEIAAEKHRVG